MLVVLQILIVLFLSMLFIGIIILTIIFFYRIIKYLLKSIWKDSCEYCVFCQSDNNLRLRCTLSTYFGTSIMSKGVCKRYIRKSKN